MGTITLCSKETHEVLTEFELSDKIIETIEKNKKPGQTTEEALEETLINAMKKAIKEEKQI